MANDESAKREGVYRDSDGWTHEYTDEAWGTPQDAAHAFIVACNRLDTWREAKMRAAARESRAPK